MTGSNSYTGGTSVNGGTLAAGSAGALPASGNVAITNATLNVASATGQLNWYEYVSSTTVGVGGFLTLNGAATQIHHLTLAGGTLAASTPDGTYGTWGFNTITTVEPISVTGGVISTISAQKFDSAWGNALTFTVDAGSTLDVTGTIGGNTGHTAFPLVKTGGGTMLLGGINSYTGTTTVNNGTLLVNGSTASGSTVTVQSGGILGGSGTIGGSVTVPTGATVAPGTGTTGTLTTGGLLLAGTYACELDGVGGDRISVTGNLDLTGAILAIATPGSGATASSYVIASYTGSLTGTFASVTGLPSGYSLTYDTVPRQIRLAKSGFGTWAALNITGTSTISTPIFISKTGITGETLTITVGSGATGTISGTILNHPDTAGGSLVKAGSGTLTLTGTTQASGNSTTLTGNVTINAGTLNVGGTVNSTSPTVTAIGNMTTAGRTITVNPGATLAFTGSDAVGQYNYKTPVMLIAEGGIITRISSANTFNSIGDVTLKNGAYLRTTNGNASTVGSFGLNGNVAVSGTSGSFIDTLSGQTTNSYINLGTTAGATTFDVAATGDATADLTVSAVLGDKVLGGAAGLIKSGAGKMVVSSANTYSGGTTLRAGTLVAKNSSAFGSSGTITVNDTSTGTNNTSLLIDATSAGITISRAITVANLGTGTATIGSSTTSGSNQAIFSGAVTINKDVTLAGGAAGDRTQFSGGITGTGNVTISGSNRIIFLSTANSYSGTTTINAGSVLQLSDGSATSTSLLPDTYGLAVTGTLKLAKGGNTETVGGLSGAGTVEAIAGSDTLSVGGGDATASFSGVLRNNGATLTLIKTGTGTQTLTGINTYTGGTTISNGTLALGNASNTLADTGAVTINGGTLSIGSNNDTVGAVTLTTGSITGPTGVLTGSSYGVSNGTISAILGGSGALTKSTTGTVTLSGSNTYTGATNINVGTLTVSGSTHVNSAVSLASGATLSGTGTVNGTVTVATGTGAITGGNGTTGQLTIGNLTFSGTGTINIGTLSGYTASPALNVTGNLTLSGGAGSVTLALPVGLLSNGTYHLAGHGNSLTDLTGFAVTGPSIGARQSGTLANNTNMIDYVVAGDSPYWTGANTTEWSGGNNWKLITAGTVTDYIAADVVLFDDNATGTTVNVGANVAPGGVEFNNSTKNYTLQGGYAITSGVLVKSGTGNLTINNSNTFAGGSTLGGGTVTLGTATALGSGSIALNAGTLDINGQTIGNAIALGGGALTGNGTISGVISGTGALAKVSSGALALSGSNTYSGGTTITAGTLNVNSATALGNAAGDLTFNGAGATLQLGATIASSTRNYVMTQTGTIDTNGYDLANSGTVSGAGGLTKTGSGTLTLSGADGYAGVTTIIAGTVKLGNATALGTTAGATSVTTGAVLDLNGQTVGAEGLTLNGAGISSGGALINSSGTAASLSGAITLGSDSSVGGGSAIALNGGISGSFGLTKIGTGTLTLSSANSYTGKTAITGGKISIAADSGLGAAPGTATADQLTLNGGSLVVSASGQTLAANRGITLGAGGGKLDISALGYSGTLTVNPKITGTGALTLAGAGDTSASGGGNANLGISLTNTANDFTGDVSITAGLVAYANNSVFGNSANKIILNGGGLIDNNVSVALSRNIEVQSGGGYIRLWNASTTTWSGNFTGTGTINRNDMGVLTLSGDLSGYTGTFNNEASSVTTMTNKIVGGAMNINGGTVNLNGTGTAGAIAQNGGSLAVGGSANVTAGTLSNSSTSGTFNIAVGGVLNATSYYANYAPSSFTVNGTLNLSGNLTFSTGGSAVSGTGTINAAGYVNQNYTSATFNAQRLNLGANGITNGSPTGTAVTFNGTTLGAYANWNSSLGLILTGTNTINTLDSKDSATARTITLSGALSGAGSLTKTGAGSLTLSGSNTYAGATMVNTGTLVINGNQSAATGSVTVSNTGTRLMGTGTVGGATTINSGAIHAPGNSPGIQAFSGNLTYSGGSIFEWDLAVSLQGTRGTNAGDATGYDGVNVGGTLGGGDAIFRVVLDSGAYTDSFWVNNHSWSDIFVKAGVSQSIASIFSAPPQWYQGNADVTSSTASQGYFTITGTSLNWTAVPEPTSALAGLLLGAGLLRRRRRNA